MAEGFVLSITPTMLKRLDEADAKISKLQTTSDKTSSKIIDDFRRMATGVDPFINKLKEAQSLLSKMSSPNISIKGFKETATDGEKAAKATASITESLNKIKSNPIDDINKKIASLKDLLNQATRSVEEYSRKMASIKSTGSGMISGTTIKEGGAGAALIPQIQAQIAALEQEKKSISSSQVLWQQRLDSLNNSSLATQRQVSDLAKLNESFRTGQSELQNQAKAQDDLAKAAEKSAAAADKQAAAEAKRNAQSQKKSDTAAERALEKYNNALNKSEVTIANRARKIEALANAERALIKTGRDYTLELTKIRTETERLNKANVDAANSVSKVKSNQRSLIDTSGQLERKLALLFSVSQIEGYVMKLINIRGEFELQNVALRAILQNKDEADRLFGQITELAVRSPFRVKELVTYTKELAAYRVESSKLYDTTKMLADVSAGLGVDMSRLILAFGQVKAANYLRGTELRQFSEAGINILGELATYYSELEGRMVSVGDVQERVTKRMVAFGDVEEIFKRITSAGGIFYNMQEIQAETLAGQMSNLGDSIDIMFNTIGKANEGTLKGSVASIRELVENWREVAFVLKDLIISFGVYKGVTSLAALGNSKFATSMFNNAKNMIFFSKATKGANTSLDAYLTKALIFTRATNIAKTAILSFGKGLLAISMMAAPVLIIGGIFELYRRMTQASRQAAELKKNLEGIVSEDVSSLDKSIKGYETLTARLSKANEGSKERRDIIASIKSQYGEYLDFIVDENTTVKQLSDSYSILIKRMKERAGAASLQKGYAEIEQNYQNDMRDARKELEDDLSKGLRINGFFYSPTEQEKQDIYNIIQSQISDMDSSLIDDAKEQRTLLNDVIEQYYGAGVALSSYRQTLGSTIDLMDIMVQKKEAEKQLEKDINFQYKETLKTREGNAALWELQNKLALDRKRIENTAGLSDFDVKEQLKAIQEQFELDKIELRFKFGEISESEMNAQKDKLINWATTTVASINETLSQSLTSAGISKENIAKVLIDKTLQNAGMSAVIKETTQGYETQQELIKQELALKSAGLDYDEKLLANAQLMSTLYEARGKVLGLELDTIIEINEATADSINKMLPPEYWITILDKQKSITTLIKETNQEYEAAKTLVTTLNNEKALGIIIDEKQLENAERDLKYLEEKRKLLGFQETIKEPKENTIYKDRISLIKEMNSQYEKLLQNYNKEEAANRVRASYKDTFAELFKGTEMEGAIATMDFDVSGAIAALEELLKTAAGEARLEAQKALDGLRAIVNLDVVVNRTEEVKSELEDLFSGYELSLELEKLNIPPELAKQLFNVDVFNLDELQKKAAPYLAELRAQGGNQIKVADDIEKKISDMQYKANVDRIKTYSKYLQQTMSERVNVELETLRKIEEINKIGSFTPEQKKEATEQVKRESVKKLDKLEFESFKEDDLYIKMFEDLDKVSTSMLTTMRERLISLKDSLKELSPTEMKEIASQMQKIDDAIQERNPFKELIPNIKEYISYLKTRNETEAAYKAEAAKILPLQEKSRKADINLAGAQQEYNLAVKTYGVNSKQAQNAKLVLLTRKQIATKAKTELSDQQKVTNELGKQVNKGREVGEAIKAAFGKAGGYATDLSNAIGEVAGPLESMFGTMSGSTKDALESTQEILGGVGEMASGIASGNYLQAAIGAIKTIGAIFAIGDKKKERQIQAEIDKVNELSSVYEDLNRIVEKGYSTAIFETGSKRVKILQEQIDSYKKMIESEKSKKKTDDARIKEWQNEIKTLNYEIEDVYSDMKDELFGTFKSLSQELGDSIIEAFKAGETAADSWGKTVDEIVANIIKKILIAKMIEPQIAKLIDDAMVKAMPQATQTERLRQEMLNAQGELEKIKDGIMTNSQRRKREEAERKYSEALKAYTKSVEAGEGEIPNINEEIADFLKEGLTGIGESFSDLPDFLKDLLQSSSQGELEGLQRGIQGVTEETAQILESLLNSMRFFVADSNTQIKNIYALFSNADAPNPILSELKAQTVLVRSIYDLFNGMTAPHFKSGGRGLKVILD